MEYGEEIRSFSNSRSGSKVNPHSTEPISSPIRNCRRKNSFDSDDDDNKNDNYGGDKRSVRNASKEYINWIKIVFYLKN